MQEMAQQHYCENEATYGETTLEDFMKNCAPKRWETFFNNEHVKKAIKDADAEIMAEKDIHSLKENGHTDIEYHIEPRMPLMFEAFKGVSPLDIKVVILGRDPTPQEGKATGRAFSVKDPLTVGSAMNVLLEVALEGWSVNLFNGDLSKWERQGVLLLNSALTIGEITYTDQNDGKRKRKQVSHLGYWCAFTKKLISYINSLPEQSVWMLWGQVAKDFTVKRKFRECYNPTKASQTDLNNEDSLISNGYVLTGGHPSPLGGAGGKNTFFAGNYFYCANVFLYNKRNKASIDWGLVEGTSKNDVGSFFYVCPKFHY
ncbi:uracil-DNA glycosylase-like [Acropora palmata]|uniref:uracil-DNA glycosylase-like n=1 Tax=Acropora palmata TaxID=6131 RepID=UPI003DA11231